MLEGAAGDKEDRSERWAATPSGPWPLLEFLVDWVFPRRQSAAAKLRSGPEALSTVSGVSVLERPQLL